jgi:TonB family protein
VFRNPEERIREGRFEITLPTSATLSRFATKQAWGWQEGEVVDKLAARVAYEDFLHRRQDPALLEKQAGNQFHARVFPIPPSGTTEIILSYSEVLVRSGEPYRVHLRGLPRLDRLDVVASVGRRSARARLTMEPIEVHEKRYLPTADFIVPLPAIAQQPQAGLRHEELALARVRPVSVGSADPLDAQHGLYVLFDSSASRALDYEAQIGRLGQLLALVAKTSGDAPLKVVCFDQEVEPIYEGTVLGFDEVARDKMIARRALGASDLSAALAYVAKSDAHAWPRLLLVTDGIATAGDTNGGTIDKRVLALAEVGVQRLDVLVAGGIRDVDRLTALVTKGLPRAGLVIDAERSAQGIAQRLGRSTISHLRVHVPNARWVWPAELNGLQAGDEALVYAELPPAEPMMIELDGPAGAGGEVTHFSYPVPLAEVERPLLERASVDARLHQLAAERASAEGERALEISRRMVALSTRFRVLCDDTALLVLESEEDYARFHITRRSLSDVLTVGRNGIEVIDRRAARWPPRLPEAGRAGSAEREAEEAASRVGVLDVLRHGEGAHLASIFGRDGALGNDAADHVGNLGIGGRGGGGEGTIGLSNLETIGKGGGGGSGSGYGRSVGPRAHRATAPDVVPATVQVRGSLDKEFIRRVVRRHLNEVKFCYERELPRNPDLHGRVTTQFTISESGVVLAAVVQQSTLNHPGVEACIVDAVRRWEFPAVPGGQIVVSYPFVFKMAGASYDDDASSVVVQEPPEALPSPATPDPPERERDPYAGKLKSVLALLARGKLHAAEQKARVWRDEDAGDVLALIALGEVAERKRDRRLAARAYGSIVDLFPARADLRRFAGERLERLGEIARPLAIDTYEKAREQRPDHPASHRLLAYAQLRNGDPEAAFKSILAGAAREYPEDRFLGVDRILREDVGLIAAAYLHRKPKARAQILAAVEKAGAELATTPSLRFVLNWETDANDVDFHIRDGQGAHAYFGQRALESGGELYADVTTGYGPECFTIPGEPSAYPYKLRAHYYSRGPMGYGMGKLEIIEHDGHGGLRFEERPFVIMTDDAYVNLGEVKAPLHAH